MERPTAQPRHRIDAQAIHARQPQLLAQTVSEIRQYRRIVRQGGVQATRRLIRPPRDVDGPRLPRPALTNRALR